MILVPSWDPEFLTICSGNDRITEWLTRIPRFGRVAVSRKALANKCFAFLVRVFGSFDPLPGIIVLWVADTTR